MGENKRWVERFSVDLKVRFGQKIFSENGRVQDISMFGFFIETSEVYPEGAYLKVQLLTPERNFIHVLGIVKWCSGILAEKEDTKRNQPPGMGIEIARFFEGRDAYKNLCQEYWTKGFAVGQPGEKKTAGNHGQTVN